MRNSLLLLALPLLSGCFTFCDGKEMMSKARAGNVRYVHELGELGNPLIPAAKSAPPNLREAFQILAERLGDSDEFKRLAAVEALRRLATRSPGTYRDHFRDLLDPLLRDPFPQIRWRAAWALGRMQLSSQALRSASEDPDDEVAERVIWALGRARDSKAESVLVAALDRSPRVQRQAIGALKRVTGMRLGDDPQAWKDSARKAQVPPPRKDSEGGDDREE
jgi:hypothetical protein